MFRIKTPIVHSYKSSSSSSLPSEAKLKATSFLKKSTTNFSLNSLDSNGAISNLSCDSFIKSKESFGDDMVNNAQNAADNIITINTEAENNTNLVDNQNSSQTFDNHEFDDSEPCTYFFRDHQVSYIDYVNASYAAISENDYLLDYLDSKYKYKE